MGEFLAAQKLTRPRRFGKPHRGFAGLLGQEERVMGLEPTTATLATWRSTTELHPQFEGYFQENNQGIKFLLQL
jgi:hypothetical protein